MPALMRLSLWKDPGDLLAEWWESLCGISIRGFCDGG
jgi:hypothetical protein